MKGYERNVNAVACLFDVFEIAQPFIMVTRQPWERGTAKLESAIGNLAEPASFQDGLLPYLSAAQPKTTAENSPAVAD